MAVLFLVIIVSSCSQPMEENMNKENTDGLNNKKLVTEVKEINQVVGDKTQILNGYVTYQDKKDTYLYNPISGDTYKVPSEIRITRFLDITDHVATVIGFNETSNLIISKWDMKTNGLTQKEYHLSNPSLEFIDAQYFDDNIFIAMSGGLILRINGEMNTYKIKHGIDFVNQSDVLVVHHDHLFVNADIGDVYQFDKDKDEFNLFSPSPTYATDKGLYYVQDRNNMKVINDNYSSSIVLPQIPEDKSIDKENSYYLIDAYKNTYVMRRFSIPHGFLYVYKEGNLVEISIASDHLPKVTLLNENELLYTDENNLYLYHIESSDKRLILHDVSPFNIRKVNDNNYYALLSFEDIKVIRIEK